MLLKSLQQEVRSFCLHHASGESYAAYREAARRWEQQQSLFVELPIGHGQQQQKKMCLLMKQARNGTLWRLMMVVAQIGMSMRFKELQAKASVRNVEVASIKRLSAQQTCRKRCFRCQGVGHVSMSCPQKTSKDKGKGKDSGKGKSSVMRGDWLKGKGKDKGKSKDKGKGKNEGYGKKGKLNEVGDATDEDWWWQDDSSGWDESTWHDGYTSQVSWADQEWYGSSWGNWDVNVSEVQEQGQSATPVAGSKGNEVQSLVLSPFIADGCEVFDTGLELIDALEDGSNHDMLHVRPQPFGGEVRPQPFGREDDVQIEEGCDGFSSSGCEGSQENGLEAGLVGSCQKGTSERSEPEKLVNRGCPVFCNCSRCFQEGVAFSRHVSDACG